MNVSPEKLHEDQELNDSLTIWREKAEMGVEKFIIQEGLLYKRARDQLGEDMLLLCVPLSYRPLVLSLTQRPGHHGMEKTTQEVLDDFC